MTTLATCVIVFIILTFDDCYGGEWRNLTGVDDSKYYRANDLSIAITSKNKLITQLKQCKEAEMQLMEGDGRSWVYFRIGGGDNEWIAMAASSKCDENGCYWVTYKYGAFINCTEFKTFYISWNNKGNIKFGEGEILGKNEVINEDLGEAFHINYVSVRSKDSKITGDWLFLKDDPPFFTAPKADGTEVVDVSESITIGTAVMTLRGGDPEGDSLTFSLLTHTDVFTVDGSELKTSALLDFEVTPSYIVRLNVYDGRNNVKASVTIRVTDVIDEAPVLSKSGTHEITEELNVGTVLPSYFITSDADKGDTNTYVLSGIDASYFNINSTTGQMSMKTRIDRDGASGRTSLDQLKLTVTDSQSLQATLDFTLTVLDINDNPPTFDKSTYVTEVTENTPADTSLGEVTVTDSDDGNNAVYTISIASGDDAASKFKFVGNILKTDSTYTDYDNADMKSKQYMYTLLVTAVDTPNEGHAMTGIATYVITLKPENDNTPKWESPTIDGNNNFDQVTTDENQDAFTTVTTFSASDADHGADGIITYSVVSVTSDDGADGASVFTLDANSGTLKTTAVLDGDVATGGVNYYSIVVKAQDGGGTPRSATGTMKVLIGKINDNAPVFAKTQYVLTVSEKSSAGTSIHKFVATDNDVGATITYTIEGDDSATFQVFGDVLKLKTALDFETKTSYVFTARASDGTLHSTTVIVVQVLDASDETLSVTVDNPISIREEQTVNTVLYGVFTLSYQGSFTYTLTGTDADEYLSIDSSTGKISLTKKIDRDDPNTGVRTLDKVHLKVDNGAGSTGEADLTFTIEDINDNPPTAQKSVYRMEVTENSQSDRTAHTTAFDDPVVDHWLERKIAQWKTSTEEARSDILLVNIDVVDKDDGNNAKIKVNITDGDDKDTKFSINGTKLYVDASRVDYDTMPDGVDVYTLTVSVEDSPDTGTVLSSVVLVIVKIISKNEFTPVWESPTFVDNSFPSVILRETVLPATEVMVFSASDKDRGADGTIRYKINSITEHFKDTKVKDAKDMFLMMSSSGTLMTAKGLDADTGITHYSIVVAAVDSGTEQRTVTGTIIVNIQNEDDANASTGRSADTTEVWVMRILVGLLAIGMLVMTLLYIKSIFTAVGVGMVHIKKVVPKVQLERPEADDSHYKKGHMGFEISDCHDDLYM